MATVTKLGNLLVKNAKLEEVKTVVEESSEDWNAFVEGELKSSNDTNNKSLGGQQPRQSLDDDDNDKDYEMNMEKIMAKFSNFNSVLSQKSNDEEEEDEEEDQQHEHEEEEDKDAILNDRD